MSGGAWAAGALVLLHLGGVGALPREVPVMEAARYVSAHPIRVLIVHGATQVWLRPGAAALVENADTGQQVATVAAGGLLTVKRRGGILAVEGVGREVRGTRFTVRPAEEGPPATLSSVGGWGARGQYPGTIEFRAAGGVDVIERVDLEAYTAGVVAAEVPKGFLLEALKAQAIAARTYTLFHLGDHEAEGADLCSRVHCHAYAGVPAPEATARQAVAETAGEVLAYHGLLIDAQYSAACGGHTVAAWETRQGKLLPYLCGAEDGDGNGAYCGQGHTVTWTKRFSYAEGQRLVARNLRTVLGDDSISPGRLLALRVEARDGDRVKWLEVKTTTGLYRVMGDSIRWLFGTGFAGPSGLRSTEFELKTKANRRGTPASFVFTGRGHGHGIGMCQWGARGRAAAGQSAEEILAAYYPGVTVERMSTPELALREP